jgi:hypothetical protein
MGFFSSYIQTAGLLLLVMIIFLQIPFGSSVQSAHHIVFDTAVCLPIKLNASVTSLLLPGIASLTAKHH